MNAETESPLDIYHFVIYHFIIWHESPNGVEVADAEDVSYSETNLGIELVIGDW